MAASPQRVALGIEYNGANYRGWQVQLNPTFPTVQGCLEQALSTIADTSIKVYCAGRTDARVHATCQVVHIESPVERPMKAWLMGTNVNLPNDIAVKWVQLVGDDFHARFSATARRYQYVIANGDISNAIFAGQVTCVKDKLDVDAMHEAAQLLLGTHDFSAFRAASCQSHSRIRDMYSVSVIRRQQFVIVEVCANAFLHHMVRNIVGSLLEVGRGNQLPQWLAELLRGKDRTLAAPTAPPDGLYLVEVSYPEQYQFPVAEKLPFLPA